MKWIACVALLLAAMTSTRAGLQDGKIALSESDLQVGARLDLSGQWLYKPGYSVASGEKPESETDPAGFVPVAVPQFLNRIYCWLDDSEDFKKREDQRLKQLGFDTDKAEDGWYRLQLDLPPMPEKQHLFLEFEGVAMTCKVYCNGSLLGGHQGMFSRFGFDLTPRLHSGGNVVAVFDSMEKIAPSSLSMGQAVTVNLTASKVKTMSKGMYGPLWPGAEQSRLRFARHLAASPPRRARRGAVGRRLVCSFAYRRRFENTRSFLQPSSCQYNGKMD